MAVKTWGQKMYSDILVSPLVSVLRFTQENILDSGEYEKHNEIVIRVQKRKWSKDLFQMVFANVDTHMSSEQYASLVELIKNQK